MRRTLLLLLLIPLALPAAAGATVRHDVVARAIYAEVNAVRAGSGEAPLHASTPLARGADAHSDAMADHNVLTHGDWSARLARSAPGRKVGETLAFMSPGRGLARRIVRAWLASPPHRAVLLDPSLDHIGLGRSRGHSGWFVTADLSS